MCPKPQQVAQQDVRINDTSTAAEGTCSLERKEATTTERLIMPELQTCVIGVQTANIPCDTFEVLRAAAKMSLEAYGDDNNNPEAQALAQGEAKHWKEIARVDDDHNWGLRGSGLNATAYENKKTGELLITIRGMEKSHLNDKDDVASGFGRFWGDQLAVLDKFVNGVEKNHGTPQWITGHSLGGHLASLWAAGNGNTKAIAIEPPGISERSIGKLARFHGTTPELVRSNLERITTITGGPNTYNTSAKQWGEHYMAAAVDEQGNRPDFSPLLKGHSIKPIIQNLEAGNIRRVNSLWPIRPRMPTILFSVSFSSSLTMFRR